MVRDPRQVVRAAEGRPFVRVFTSSGQFVSKWEWPRGTRTEAEFPSGDDSVIQNIGWLQDESLLVTVAVDGTVTFYDMRGEYLHSFSITHHAHTRGYEVRMSRFFGTGLAVLVSRPTRQAPGADGPRPVADAKLVYYLTRSPEIYRVDADDGLVDPSELPEVRCLCDLTCDGKELTVEPHAIEVIPPGLRDDAHGMKIFLSPHEHDVERGTLWECTQDRVIDLYPSVTSGGAASSPGIILRLALSPTGQFLATFDATGTVSVLHSDLSQQYSTFATKSKEPPNQLLWCGSECVLSTWLPHQIPKLKGKAGENTMSLILLIGCLPETHENYSRHGPVHAVSERDSARVLSNHFCDIVQPVPDATVAIFEDGPSDHPAMTLWDAYVDYEQPKESATSVRSIRRLKPAELTLAVDTCIEAAGHEFDKQLQTRLLRAAAYGKCFCKNYDADKFVAMSRNVRVLNAVRDPEVGLPLTWNQFYDDHPDVQCTDVPRVIDRLLSRHLFLLAYRISSYLGEKTERVLVAWGRSKVRTKARDEIIARDIEDKFRDCPGISYRHVADEANRIGKHQLAIKLLMKEPKAEDQVPLLLRLGEDELALKKAMESGDTDLIYLVVLRMKRDHQDHAPVFMRVLSAPENQEARDLFIVHSQFAADKSTRAFLQEYYREMHIDSGSAFLALRHMLDRRRAPDAAAWKRCLDAAHGKFRAAKRDVEAKCCDDQRRLLDLQTKYASDYGDDDFTGPLPAQQPPSIAGTLGLLFKHRALSAADKMRKELAVPDRMFAWIKLRSLCEHGHWELLWDWSKPIIGYKAFVVELMKYGRKGKVEAARYWPKISDFTEKCEMLCRLGMYKEAVDTAEKEKDPEMLQTIRGYAPSDGGPKPDAGIVARIDRLLSQF
eukprot:TRINITY_DN50672_c0_g1_i1.p1 TRINITY_DN50672_c0_g1~~TRINITY_DN50672_c0_g1_i1.p1  ORF type:complete len:991 (+),score=313.60 TRINITY_DN50672_c0_g1_i1:301-2973(+)